MSPRRLSVGVLAMSLALACGGCSFSYQLDSGLGGSKDDSAGDITGSLRPRLAKPLQGMPPEGDLAIARAAVAEVMTKGGKDSSMPWENPQTGARGTVTPVTSPYEENGLTCRDFLASYVREGREAWMHGEACRAQQGKWEIRNLKPWQRT